LFFAKFDSAILFYGKNHKEMTGHNIFYEFSNMQKKYLKNALFRGFFDTFNI